MSHSRNRSYSRLSSQAVTPFEGSRACRCNIEQGNCNTENGISGTTSRQAKVRDGGRATAGNPAEAAGNPMQLALAQLAPRGRPPGDGTQSADLHQVAGDLTCFDAIVAENGAVLGVPREPTTRRAR